MKHIYLLLILLFVAGCNSNVSMSGRVTYSDTGEPVELGTVAFSSPTSQSRGGIKEDGKYVIGTFSGKDGLPRGEHSINLIDPKYQKAETSGLKVVVDGKTKTFDIQVDRAMKQK